MGDYRALRTEGRRVDKVSDWIEREKKKGKRMVGVSGGVGWGITAHSELRGDGLIKGQTGKRERKKKESEWWE